MITATTNRAKFTYFAEQTKISGKKKLKANLIQAKVVTVCVPTC
jgi:hypothetical protein